MGIVVPFDRPAAPSDVLAHRLRKHLNGPDRPDIPIADRQAVERIVADYPNLAPNGLFAPRCQSRADFDAARLTMTGDMRLGEFRRALAFLLVCCDRRNTLNRRATSYGLKHAVEREMRAAGERPIYCSNGMFLAAALTLGFKVAPIHGTPNAFLNIDVKRETDR